MTKSSPDPSQPPDSTDPDPSETPEANTDAHDSRDSEDTDTETSGPPPLTEFLTKYDTRRFRERLSSEPPLDSSPLLETAQQLIDQSTATIGRPTRTYPPPAQDRFPELAAIADSQVPRGDVLRLQIPYKQSLYGPKTVSIDVPAVSAFERIADRPDFFCECCPGTTGIHDTNFLLDTHAGVIDLSVVYGIYDERSELNYGLRIVTDTDGVVESGQFLILLEGQETSLIVSPAELRLLIRHTACGFVTPITDAPTQTADCETLARHYATAAARRGLVDEIDVVVTEHQSASSSSETGTPAVGEATTEQPESPQFSVDATCPVKTPTGQHDLFMTDAVRIASADSVPVASVGVDLSRLVTVTESVDELTTATLSSVPVSLTPEIAGVPTTTIPLPAFADGLALGQYQPLVSETE